MFDPVVVPSLLIGGDGREFGGADRAEGRRMAEEMDPVARRPVPETNLAMRRFDGEVGKDIADLGQPFHSALATCGNLYDIFIGAFLVKKLKGHSMPRFLSGSLPLGGKKGRLLAGLFKKLQIGYNFVLISIV